jgi:AmiR/NasT family two-component response regulator
MMSLLLVLPNEFDASAPLPEPLRQGLAEAGATVLGRAACRTLVQQAGALAPQQVLVWLSEAAQARALCDALQAWSCVPPCAVSVVSEPLESAQHEALVALGVHAWAPLDALSLPALLARAQARWTREAALRTELDNLRTRMDERKWVDRAKGLLMSARGIGEDEAFGLLRGGAMHANLRLGEVSRSVIEAAQWAEAINRAGQLRMLSQRLVRVAAQLLAGIDVQRARVLRTQSTERVQQNLDHLATLELGAAGVQALGVVQTAWNGLGTALAVKPTPQGLAEIDARGEALLLGRRSDDGGAGSIGCAARAAHRQHLRAAAHAGAAAGERCVAGIDAGCKRLARPVAADHGRIRGRAAGTGARPPQFTRDPRRIGGARDEWLRLVGGVQALDSPEGRATLVRSSEALVDTFERLTGWYEHSLQVIMS